MARVILYMAMAVDGFIAGPDDRKGQGLGRDGGRLFNWLDDRMSAGPSGRVFQEALATGAVIAGRRTFELADRWHGHRRPLPVALGPSEPGASVDLRHASTISVPTRC